LEPLLKKRAKGRKIKVKKKNLRTGEKTTAREIGETPRPSLLN